MRESQGLLGTLQRLLARSVHSDVEQYRAWKDRLREDAELKVDLSLTIAARKLMAYPHLVELEMVSKKLQRTHHHTSFAESGVLAVPRWRRFSGAGISVSSAWACQCTLHR